jgi:hypothetical protein
MIKNKKHVFRVTRHGKNFEEKIIQKKQGQKATKNKDKKHGQSLAVVNWQATS